jgi:hypothetical protein
MFRNGKSKLSVGSFLNATLCFALILFTEFATGISMLETKLECQLEINTEFFHLFNGETSRETKKEMAIVNVSEYGKNLIIIVEGSEPIISVSTGNMFGQVKSYYNQSTENVWQLSNELNHRGGGEGSNDLRIDRNTGLITFLRLSSSKTSAVKVNGTGYCSKVDTTKKKF